MFPERAHHLNNLKLSIDSAALCFEICAHTSHLKHITKPYFFLSHFVPVDKRAKNPEAAVRDTI